MAAQLGSQDNEGINEINITPFVDIVLVLLIIFMISTPALVYKGLRISLPTAVAPESITHVTLNLLVTKDGGLYLDNKKITQDELKRAFVRLKEAKTRSDALISADAAVPHGAVMQISDYLRTLGVQQIGFATGTSAHTENAEKSDSKISE